MTEEFAIVHYTEEFKILHYLSGLRQNQGVRVVNIVYGVGLPANPNSASQVRRCLESLKTQELVDDYKTRSNSNRKLWKITDKGRSDLARAKEAIEAVIQAAKEKLRQIPDDSEV
ncbi:helix-turn-helix transcriptional regulator [Pseudanabaena sp. PCC 6802]|uniref:helix-turn-helix transcriptional regulator n=1 Tax=Pseudanabaena sp. PCC 6802 TaxID=118173 RepID=UPI00037A3EAB|nr:helix-turn-helix transcriptional regulator [Pseudanabaena sp. PCC 6802]